MMRNRNWRTSLLPGVIASIVVASYAWLAAAGDLRTAIPEMVAATAGVTVLLAFGAFTAKGRAWSPILILGVAAGIRLFFLFQPPTLSDDIFRYAWDGFHTLAGTSPYALPPAAETGATAGMAALLKCVNHPGLVTIYPPAAQLFFAAGGFLGGITGIKALLVVLDLGTCLLILRLLERRNLPAGGAVLYAWHPLPVLEIAGSGHIDGAALFLLAGALLVLERRKDRAAGVVFAAATLVKLFPAVYAPAFLMTAAKRGRFAAAACAAALLLTIPFLPTIANGLPTLSAYARDWEFGGFLFRLLRDASSGGTARMLLLGTYFVVVAAVYFPRLRLGKMEAGEMPGAMYAVTIGYLLLTPTLHPWYALYLVLLLPLAGGPGGIVLSWAVILGYRVLLPYSILGVWVEDGLTPLLVSGGTAAAAATTFFLHGKRLRRLVAAPQAPPA